MNQSCSLEQFNKNALTRNLTGSYVINYSHLDKLMNSHAHVSQGLLIVQVELIWDMYTVLKNGENDQEIP